MIQTKIKGYWNHIGYMGWVDHIGDYMQFSCERDYIEYLEEETERWKEKNL